MTLRHEFSYTDFGNDLFALIRAAESGDAAGDYSVLNPKKKSQLKPGESQAIGAYQFKNPALQAVGAIKDGSWTGDYGNSAADFRGSEYYQDDAAATYINQTIGFVNRFDVDDDGNSLLGTTFKGPQGNDIPITEDGFVLAAWEQRTIASRVAHGFSYDDLVASDLFPKLNTPKDADSRKQLISNLYNDAVSRFEAGALLEGWDVPDATNKAQTIDQRVEAYNGDNTINFDFNDLGRRGPDLYRNAGPTQTFDLPGNLTVYGGVLLTSATNSPADQSTIYGTDSADNADPSLASTLTFIFKDPVNAFSLQLLNGEDQERSYTLTDNLGDTYQATLPSNHDGGIGVMSLLVADGATKFQVYSNDQPWDFAVDKLKFTFA